MAEGGELVRAKIGDQRQRHGERRKHPLLALQAVQGALEFVGARWNRKISPPDFDFTSDFGEDFMSTCKAVDERLIKLGMSYQIFSQPEVEEHLETGRQFNEKQILISFVGSRNVGKSTLLNALLRARLLPMKRDVETSVKVHIQHDEGDTCVGPEATPDQHPKLLLEKGKISPDLEEVVGTTEIYRKLETLNAEVHKDDDLKVCFSVSHTSNSVSPMCSS